MSLKLTEPWAVTQLRKDHRDALQTVGEQCVVLSMRHAGVDDADERCPECFDDVYSGGESGCTVCYGTTFAEPVKHAAKVWGMFSDQDADEQLGQRGVWQSDTRQFETEAFPELLEHDYVVRVRQWDRNGRITEIEGFYGIGKVTASSVRTGDRFGQHTWDVVGQKASIAELASSNGITKYPVLDKTFDRPLVGPITSLGAPPVVTPDTKVVYVPVMKCPDSEPEPLTPTPPPGVQWRQIFIHTQQIPATVWTITHPFEYTPSVTLFVGGEEADTDTDFPDPHTVVLTFAEPHIGVVHLI